MIENIKPNVEEKVSTAYPYWAPKMLER